MLPLVAVFAVAGAARAEPHVEASMTNARPSPAWCAPEVEELTEGVCHIDGGQPEGRRTLVIFLHGAIAKDTTWQWTQERALLRQARQAHFEAIFPRAPLGTSGYVWPGSLRAQQGVEQELIDGWIAARKMLEAKSGKPYDDVFVMGFSSGAYFVSSLALRGRLDVDGYAVFAGGVAYAPRPGETPHPTPVFVGVCANDPHTAPDSRALGGALSMRGWPHRVDEEHVGHMFSDVHVVHAVSYLRRAAARRHD